MFKKTLVVSIFLLLSALPFFGQNKSVYTSLTEKDCQIKLDSQISGNLSGLCPGTGRYKLKIYADDDRMSLSVVAPDQKTFDLDFWGYFDNFSSIGEKAEWRMKGRKPVGLIVRYDVSDRGEGKTPTSYVMVSKISSAGSCVVAIVKPGKNQNVEARKIADSAVSKPCRKTE